MVNVAHLQQFIEFTHKFQQVKRMIWVKGEDRQENDSEHSYQLAITAWYLIEHDELQLNTDLVVKYALVHDLVEAYAGDTPAFDEDPQVHETKHQRENEAKEQIKLNFPQFASLHKLISDYEHKIDEESKFVYAVDKILTALNIMADNGRTWKKVGVNLEMIEKYKREKVSMSPIVAEYFEELIKIIKANESHYLNGHEEI